MDPGECDCCVLIDNIQVRFFETTQDGMVWEAFADFGQGDVHRQVRRERALGKEGQGTGKAGRRLGERVYRERALGKDRQ